MGFLDEVLKQRIEEIRNRINNAAKRAGRNPKDIILVGVTKKVDSQAVIKAKEYGITEFGENRVQELTKKIQDVSDVNWHMIGHLQTNKIKSIISKVCLIHSLDSINLAEEINREAQLNNLIIDCLVQVNISREITKHGIFPEQCEDFLNKVSRCDNIRVKGLMTIAPRTENIKEIRRNFYNINKLFIDMSRKKIHNINMEYLSSGMTSDFEIAIEEGANIVRIGTGIFGDRY